MRWWSAAYTVLTLLIAACAVRYAMSRTSRRPSGDAEIPARRAGAEVSARRRIRWIVLALVPSSYMLGVTTFITADVAAIPLLWVVPLALYLLSFVLAFGWHGERLRKPFLTLLPLAALAAALLLLLRIASPLALVLPIHLLAFFCAAMVCHAELARSRPAAQDLTDFYLMVSVGGVLGGVFNALVAPVIFPQPLEYPLAIVLGCLVAAPIGRAEGGFLSRYASPRVLDVVLPLAVAIAAAVAVILSGHAAPSRAIAVIVLNLLLGSIALCLALIPRPRRFAAGLAGLLLVYALVPTDRGRVQIARRSFFGVHRVLRSEAPPLLELHHGGTLHGCQKVDAAGQPAAPLAALTYYHRTGPIGDLLTRLPQDREIRIAAIGLGVGSIAAYAGPHTRMTFYEIDPTVRWAADESGYFTYLSAARQRGADVKIVIGDARLTLSAAPVGSLDVVVVDAFSGDAIPTHLLTREAFGIYLDRLKPDGIVMVHVSNAYLDLEPVVARLGAAAGCETLVRHDLKIGDADAAEGKGPSDWLAIGKSPTALDRLRGLPHWHRAHCVHDAPPWSDDFTNMIPAFRWWRAPG